MRKYILSILMLIGLFVLSACGTSGSDNISDNDTVPVKNAVEVSSTKMTIDGNSYSLKVLLTKKVDSSYKIELSNFKLTADNCKINQQPIFNPDILYMNGGINSIAAIDINGTFAQDCSDTTYTFSATQKTTKNGKTDVRTVSITGDSKPIVDSGFLNATTPMEISKINSSYEIKVQMIENGYVAEGKVVKMKPFDSPSGKYGEVDNYEATTGADGYATFLYTSPSDLLAIDGTSITLELTYTADNGVVFTQNIVLNFNSTPDNTLYYTLQAVPTDFSVSETGENKTISLYVVDTRTNSPVADVVIKADFFDPNNGTLNTYSATTNANGQAVFNYIAPATLPIGTTFPITFSFENATEPKPVDVTVEFSTSSVPPVDTTGMLITPVPADFNITTAGETKVITIYLSRGTDSVADVNIKANFFDPNNGTLDNYIVKTNTNGQAVFVYTAPNELPTTPLTITFDVENPESSIAQNVTVNFVQGNATSTYTIQPDQNLTVDGLNKAYTLKVALWKQEPGGIAEPAVGEVVVAEYLMPVNGTISQYEATVDASGVAVFEYTSPDRLLPTADANVTFYYKEDHTVTGKTLLIFDTQVIDTVSEMYVSPLSFTITSPGEEKSITIVTVNSNNIGISTNVQLEQPNNGTDYGQFDKTNVTTNDSGYAVVKYTAPQSISGLVERNITVTELSQNISKELNMKFNTSTGPGIDYEITVVLPNALSVDSNDQITVKIHEIGDETAIIDDANVLDVNLTSIFTNMLTFANNSTTVNYNQSGTKPLTVETKTLSGTALIDINASIYDGSQNVLISKQVSVTVLSGPVTSMSLLYANTLPDEGTGIYKNTYTIHAVDKYDNPARAGIVLHPSIINGTTVVKTDSATEANGTITNATPDTFSDTTAPFGAVDSSKDILAIVSNADRTDQAYLGNWSIDSVNSFYDQLTLAEDYLGSTTDSLNYVIGNSNRYIDQYGIATVDIQSATGSYVTDENGMVQFTVSFDRILAGHTVTISANAYDVKRTGVSVIAGLRWGKYSSTVEKVPNDGNDHIVNLQLGIDDGIEPLVGLEIVPSSIVSNDAACDVNMSLGASNDFITDANGMITVQISTQLNISPATECNIRWSATQAAIYKEY